jgi:hypothetical protein
MVKQLTSGIEATAGLPIGSMPNASGPPRLITNVGPHKSMRLVYPILPTLLVIILAGCAHNRAESLSWNGRTILPGGQSIVSLNALANNSACTRDERARAIFNLFAHHIRPGASAAQVHAVLTDTNWMSDVNLYRIRALGGWAPVELNFEDSVFCLQLFPVEMNKQWSPWGLYFRLSGHGPNGLARSEEEADAFLRGDTTLHGNPKLVEFALCYPEQPNTRHSRRERFTRQGIHVYDF